MKVKFVFCFLSQATNKNLVAQAEELVKDRTNQASVFAQKLEEKLTKVAGKSSEFESQVSGSLSQMKIDLKDILSNGVKSSSGGGAAGLSEADREFLRDLSNDTIDAIQDMRLEVLTASDKSKFRWHHSTIVSHTLTFAGFAKTATRIEESHNEVKEVSKALSEFTSIAETFYTDATKASTDISSKIDGITTLEKIMLDTSNNVLETKRRFEYGIHQIVLEVSEVMKLANTSMQKRLNELNDGILENHNMALVNLSSKIETEISQVWRQIGIMYQEITSSKKALDRLQEQAEVYVNGTLTTMDAMEGKVGLITTRMQEVDENLNYLLGRLSLVTQEFNNIKIGLGDALDNIKGSFKTVQDKVNQNIGPGPHNINEHDSERDLNALRKRNARNLRRQNV